MPASLNLDGFDATVVKRLRRRVSRDSAEMKTPSTADRGKRRKVKSATPREWDDPDPKERHVDVPSLPYDPFINTPRPSKPVKGRRSRSKLDNPFITPSPEPRLPPVRFENPKSLEYGGFGPSDTSLLVITERPPEMPPAVKAYVSAYTRKHGRRSLPTHAELGVRRWTMDDFEEVAPQQKPLDLNLAETRFVEWKAQMAVGYNILVYGFGSKFELLETFGRSVHCEDGAVLSFRCFAGIRASRILEAVAKLYFPADYREMRRDRALLRLHDEERKCYLILHNIDAEKLRTPIAQAFLAVLADCPCISLVASMDHVLAPQLWDHFMAERFNFSMSAVHTSQHYFKELKKRNPPLLTNPFKEEAALDEIKEAEVALLILRSFVRNAQQCFIVLAQKEEAVYHYVPKLKNLGTQNANQGKGLPRERPQGVTVNELFAECRKRFVCSTVAVLRRYLDDFIKHELVTKRKNSDGGDAYHVILMREALDLVLNEL